MDLEKSKINVANSSDWIIFGNNIDKWKVQSGGTEPKTLPTGRMVTTSGKQRSLGKTRKTSMKG